MPQTPLNADELRPYKEQALAHLTFAREVDATELKSTVDFDDQPAVTYIVERTPVANEVNGAVSIVEHITVKRGRSSGMQVLFAGPAAWLEA